MLVNYQQGAIDRRSNANILAGKMILADGTLAIYISAGLAGFLVLLWCCAMCVCKGPCRSFDETVKSPFEMHMDPASRTTALRNKYDVYHYHLMVSHESFWLFCWLFP